MQTVHLCNSNIQQTLPFPFVRAGQNTAVTVDPTLAIYAPGTHHCWLAKGSVNSKLSHDFCTGPGTVGIEHQTLRSWVQCINRSNICILYHSVLYIIPSSPPIPPLPPYIYVPPSLPSILVPYVPWHGLLGEAVAAGTSGAAGSRACYTVLDTPVMFAA